MKTRMFAVFALLLIAPLPALGAEPDLEPVPQGDVEERLRSEVVAHFGIDPGAPTQVLRADALLPARGTFSAVGDGNDLLIQPVPAGIPPIDAESTGQASCVALDDDNGVGGWLSVTNPTACIHAWNEFDISGYALYGQTGTGAVQLSYDRSLDAYHVILCWGGAPLAVRGLIWVQCVAAYWTAPLEEWNDWHAFLYAGQAPVASTMGAVTPWGNKACDQCVEIVIG